MHALVGFRSVISTSWGRGLSLPQLVGSVVLLKAAEPYPLSVNLPPMFSPLLAIYHYFCVYMYMTCIV